jgi:hypothetical protein
MSVAAAPGLSDKEQVTMSQRLKVELGLKAKGK